jgi:integrase
MATISELPGNRKKPWRLAYSVGGKRVTEHFATEKLANRALAKLELAKERGEENRDMKITYGKILDLFLENDRRRNDICDEHGNRDLGGNTLYGRELLVKNHIRPALGHIKLSKLDAVPCQNLLNRAAAGNKETPHQIRSMLKMTLEFAANGNYTSHGKVAEILKRLTVSKRKVVEPRIPTARELYCFIYALLTYRGQSEITDEKRVSVLLFLLLTGARASEATALRWENTGLLDPSGKYKICKGWNRIDKEKGTKSGGTYKGDLPPAVRRSLIPIWERQGRPTKGPVYMGKRGKEPVQAQDISRNYFSPVMAACGFNESTSRDGRGHGINLWTLHKLRHVFASLELKRGATLLETSKKLCHRKLGTLDRYAHVFEDASDEQVFEAIELLLENYANSPLPTKLSRRAKAKRRLEERENATNLIPTALHLLENGHSLN